MLNKIKLIGKILLNKWNKNNELLSYFSLLVTNPNNSSTIIRCYIGKIKSKEIENIKENEYFEIDGYLKNEINDRQIIVHVVRIKKVEFLNEEKKIEHNEVKLLGIVDELEKKTNLDGNINLISFKIFIPGKLDSYNQNFFCAIKEINLIKKIIDILKLKKNDIIYLKGFLQTKKIKNVNNKENFSRASLIICYYFFKIENYLINEYDNFVKFETVSGEIEKIDFNSPKK